MNEKAFIQLVLTILQLLQAPLLPPLEIVRRTAPECVFLLNV